MLLDTPKTFAVLEHFGVRVARAKLVDSAEDAIAFAGRRDAADDRAVPIALRTAGSATAALSGHDAIRAAYARLAAESFRVTVRLHENTYTVADAALSAPHEIRLKQRLAHHAPTAWATATARRAASSGQCPTP